MLNIKYYPRNKEQFIRLVEFCKIIYDLCKKLSITPVLYGGLAVFGYTKNRKMTVNDIDFLIPQKWFKKLKRILVKQKIKHTYVAKWHIMQVLKEDLIIEFDALEYWQKDLPRYFQSMNIHGLILKTVNLKALTQIYKHASEISKDNPKGNRKNMIC